MIYMILAIIISFLIIKFQQREIDDLKKNSKINYEKISNLRNIIIAKDGELLYLKDKNLIELHNYITFLRNIIKSKDKYITEIDNINIEINNVIRSSLTISQSNNILFAELEVKRINSKNIYNSDIREISSLFNFNGNRNDDEFENEIEIEINNYIIKIKELNKDIENRNNIINLNNKEINDLMKIRDTQRNKIIELKNIIDNLTRNDDYLTCSICLETVHHFDNKKITRCNHTFHTDCLYKWDRNTCPNCRSDL
jgi:hypothetical protein